MSAIGVVFVAFLIHTSSVDRFFNTGLVTSEFECVVAKGATEQLISMFPNFFSWFTGVAPPSVLAVQAGTTLYQLTSSRDAFSFTSVVSLVFSELFVCLYSLYTVSSDDGK